MKKEIKDYFLGLDVGTGSVGWAVTDADYKLLKANRKDLWGMRCFETAETAEVRRLHRCYFTHTMTIHTLIYKFYNSILSINLRTYTSKFPCT